MYLIGAEHPSKHTARRALDDAIDARERLVTDVEVLQEILHRYSAIGRRDAIDPAFHALSALADEILPISSGDVMRAKEIVLQETRLSARDAIHVAVMERHGVRRIMTADRAFDLWPGLQRLPI